MAQSVTAEIVKVELADRYADHPVVLVTATSSWGVDVTFKVSARLALAYTVGRIVNVEIALEPRVSR